MSGTQYTLVVTPAANSTGSIAVSVTASSYEDTVGNRGQAAATSQSFDTLPPVVSVTSSAAGSTASGDVTLTFNFSKEVGSSFDAADITVTGGSKGAFTRVNASRATLVVTPDANSAGNLEVSVAADSFSDSASRSNSAATPQQLH